MDGIGIQLLDDSTPDSSYEIAGTQAAGAPPLTIEHPRFCFEVMTGAVAPTGVNCVIPIEALDIEETQGARVAKIMAPSAVKIGNFIHPMGSDSNQGAALVNAGCLLGIPELATAASNGAAQLEVSKLPVITLLTSGDEVIPIDHTPLAHQIRASHPIAIRSSIESNKLGTVKHQHLADDPKLIEQSIRAALTSSDILILTGGVSKGKFDFIAPVLRELCGPAKFHGISQRPGKPFAYHSSPIPIFALPGNPLSVMACLARYVLPALHQHAKRTMETEHFMINGSVNGEFHLTQLLACKISNGEAIPASPKNSGEYTAIHGCTGIVEIPAHCGVIEKLNPVPFYPW